ncbi:hypothetical protein P3X46_033568 [Hevea brasiliensis]|uniref:RNase H type-1 domain-containing protein n=1 Tax=Hevea brasiliensis TaxID=3981 RepID=A0ABQ9KBQ1_HEVBR|nr:hypothetical protein P3X46_033568 [Hevea brasiliensis]
MLTNSNLLNCWTEVCSYLAKHPDGSYLIQSMAFILWHTWKSRNALIFHQQTQTWQDVISNALKYQENFILATIDDAVKFNFDATVDKQNNKGAIVVIAQDQTRRIIDWRCSLWPSTIDPLLLESIACREVARLAVLLGFQKIIIEGDSAIVVHALHNQTLPIPI